VGVKGRVEARNLRDRGHQLPHGADACDRSRVVQGREVLDGVEVGEHVVVDEYGLGQPGAAVDDAVPDRFEVVDPLDEVADRFQVVLTLQRSTVVPAT